MPDYYSQVSLDGFSPLQEYQNYKKLIKDEVKDKIEKLEEPLFRSVPVLREPKLENSFIFEFPPNIGIESFMVQTAEKPNISLNESEEYEWHSMKVQILELTDNSTLKGVQKMLSNKNGFDCTLKDLDCCGVMLNEWL